MTSLPTEDIGPQIKCAYMLQFLQLISSSCVPTATETVHPRSDCTATCASTDELQDIIVIFDNEGLPARVTTVAKGQRQAFGLKAWRVLYNMIFARRLFEASFCLQNAKAFIHRNNMVLIARLTARIAQNIATAEGHRSRLTADVPVFFLAPFIINCGRRRQKCADDCYLFTTRFSGRFSSRLCEVCWTTDGLAGQCAVQSGKTP